MVMNVVAQREKKKRLMRNLFLYKLGKIKECGKKKKIYEEKDDIHAQHENYMARCAAYFFCFLFQQGERHVKIFPLSLSSLVPSGGAETRGDANPVEKPVHDSGGTLSFRLFSLYKWGTILPPFRWHFAPKWSQHGADRAFS